MMNQNVMRDPLRAGMEARAHGLPKLLLGVAAVLVFFALEMKNCAGMEGAAAVALIGAACMALLTFGAWRALKEQPVWCCCARRCWRCWRWRRTWQCWILSRDA